MTDPNPPAGAPDAVIVFVYFRAAPAARAAVTSALRALVGELGGDAPASIELALRDEPGAAWHTWLEHHRLAADADVPAYLARLADAARRLSLEALADGGRHVEVFRTLDARCA